MAVNAVEAVITDLAAGEGKVGLIEQHAVVAVAADRAALHPDHGGEDLLVFYHSGLADHIDARERVVPDLSAGHGKAAAHLARLAFRIGQLTDEPNAAAGVFSDLAALHPEVRDKGRAVLRPIHVFIGAGHDAADQIAADLALLQLKVSAPEHDPGEVVGDNAVSVHDEVAGLDQDAFSAVAADLTAEHHEPGRAFHIGGVRGIAAEINACAGVLVIVPIVGDRATEHIETAGRRRLPIRFMRAPAFEENAAAVFDDLRRIISAAHDDQGAHI